MTDLGVLYGSGNSFARGINDHGEVVGDSVSVTETGKRSHAFRWSKGQMTDLGTLPGGRSSGATGINSLGQVVGWSTDAAGDQRAVLWHKDQIVDLGALSGNTHYAAGINDEGQVVGFSYTLNVEGSRAFLWQDGRLTDLGDLGGLTTLAYGINNHGDIVGESQDASGRRQAFIMHCQRRWCAPMVALPLMEEASFARAVSINEARLIVGFVIPDTGVPRAVYWHRGAVHLLPPLDERFPTEASGVNNYGDITGTAMTECCQDAVVWSRFR